jgi:uncharacterized membrane protein
MDEEPRTTVTGFFKRLTEFRDSSDAGSKSFFSRIRTRLVVGLLVTFPLLVTLVFARFVFRVLDQWFRPISERFFGFPLVGVGAALVVLGLLLIGTLATNVFGNRLLTFFERIVGGIPLLSPIYQGARQITEALQARDPSQFRRVVLIRFPTAEVWSVGFVTREFAHPTQLSSEATALVFVPTTPNPTSGFLISARARDLRSLPISVEEGVKFVISGGLLTPSSILFTDEELKVLAPGKAEAGE